MRDSFLDNAKFGLILLVVFGHLLTQIPSESMMAHALYLSIYAFHMPAFIFLAGITAKPEKWGHNDLSLVWGLALFQCAYGASQRLTHHPVVTFPFGLLWFLLSLLCWRAAAVLLYRRVPGWLVVSGSIVLSVLAGYLPFGGEFSLMRTCVFCPFFFLGLYCGPRVLSFVRDCSIGTMLTSALLFAVVLIGAANSQLNPRWVLGDTRYAALIGPSSLAYPWEIRAALLGLAIVLTLAFLVLIPATRQVFTDRGRTTLAVYLLHGLILMPIYHLMAHTSAGRAWALLLVSAPAVVVLLSTDRVSLYLATVLNLPSTILRRATSSVHH